MKRRLIVAAAAVVCLALGVFLTDRVSGGKVIENQVAAAVRTSGFIIHLLGGPITKIDRSDGPWRVQLRADGTRDGFFSFLIEGTQSKGDFRVEWTQIARGWMKIIRISLRAPPHQDKLLWESAVHDPSKRGQ